MTYLALCLLESGNVLTENTVNSIHEARLLTERCFSEEKTARRTVVVQQSSGQIIATWNREDFARI